MAGQVEGRQICCCACCCRFRLSDLLAPPHLAPGRAPASCIVRPRRPTSLDTSRRRTAQPDEVGSFCFARGTQFPPWFQVILAPGHWPNSLLPALASRFRRAPASWSTSLALCYRAPRCPDSLAVGILSLLTYIQSFDERSLNASPKQRVSQVGFAIAHSLLLDHLPRRDRRASDFSSLSRKITAPSVRKGSRGLISYTTYIAYIAYIIFGRCVT